MCSITFSSLLELNSSHMTVNYVAEIDRNFNLNSECSVNTYFYRLLRQLVLSLLSYHLLDAEDKKPGYYLFVSMPYSFCHVGVTL